MPSQHDELELIGSLQKGYVNFYAPGALMPYIPLAAKGPWIVTTHGAVVHDSGGYGMLGFGHNDDRISGMRARGSGVKSVNHGTDNTQHVQQLTGFSSNMDKNKHTTRGVKKK